MGVTGAPGRSESTGGLMRVGGAGAAFAGTVARASARGATVEGTGLFGGTTSVIALSIFAARAGGAGGRTGLCASDAAVKTASAPAVKTRASIVMAAP